MNHPAMPLRAAAAVPSAALRRSVVIGLTAFLSLVDLFATQAILPSLARAYHVMPAAMGFAVNASTIGMAISGLLVALFSHRLNRRHGIWISLAVLSVPTSLLAVAPDLASFTALRVAQGLFMSAAFSLTLAYLAETFGPREAAGALAAYITGNVASNLFGRLISAAVADHLGLASNFLFFAALNLAGAALVYVSLNRATPLPLPGRAAPSQVAAVAAHLRNGSLLACFGIGFCILFAFIGTFTYGNFVLSRAPFAIGAMQLGFVYFVFLPAIATTPLAGVAVARFGARPAFWCAMAVSGIALPLLLMQSLALVLTGLALAAAGMFFAQAIATGFVGRAATGERGSAGGIYLACYFFGGLAGSAVLGQVFDQLGWASCVAGVGCALLVGALLALGLKLDRGAATRLQP